MNTSTAYFISTAATLLWLEAGDGQCQSDPGDSRVSSETRALLSAHSPKFIDYHQSSVVRVDSTGTADCHNFLVRESSPGSEHL